MSRLSESQAKHAHAQHVADYAARRVSKAMRELTAATEEQAGAEEALEAAACELAEARRESLGGASA